MISHQPKIHGPSVFGVRPGHPFFYQIPLSGLGRRIYGAKGLPGGLDLDPYSGRITGRLKAKGRHGITLTAQVEGLKLSRSFRIICGEEIGLTPALGWNSWNVWGHEVSQAKVLSSAQAMARHLRDYGWSYVNIDDGWQGDRDSRSCIRPNGKFSDMAGLVDEIHGMGLKIGIYSTPWQVSYAGFLGGSSSKAGAQKYKIKKWPAYVSQQKIGKQVFEKADAKQWAQWGFDYLKYDWHPNDVASTRRMHEALRASGRDILLSLSNTVPVHQLHEIRKYANSWRTTGDLKDYPAAGPLWSHDNTSRNGYLGVKDVLRFHSLFADFQSPGHFNDADMLLLGRIGWGDPKPTPLSRQQQLSHLVLWCLFASPLFIGCDLTRLDSFTLSLLTHEGLLEIHQDSLGAQAQRLAGVGSPEAWMKPLEDGSLACGLFNMKAGAHEVKLDWAELGFRKAPQAWDVLARRSLGRPKKFTRRLPGHGVALLRLMA